MTFNHFNRRLHLYLGLSLLPWFFMYGISSWVFNHPPGDDGKPMWITRFDRPYEIAVPPGDNLRAVGTQILKDAGLEGSYGTYRQNPKQVNVFVRTFWHSTRLTYYPDEKRLLAEDRRFRWSEFLTGMHNRGGFEHDTALEQSWSVIVDLANVGIVLWIASGLYMWWCYPFLRGWGLLALCGGVASFVLFLLRL